MTVHGRRLPLPAPVVRRIVRTVLRGERRRAVVSVTFLGRDGMRSLNSRFKGRDQPTDVLAFALRPSGGARLGDVYVCAWAAARAARAHRIPLRQELVRLVVHGTLHVLGRDHPEGPERVRSAMWRRQEQYVEALA